MQMEQRERSYPTSSQLRQSVLFDRMQSSQESMLPSF